MFQTIADQFSRNTIREIVALGCAWIIADLTERGGESLAGRIVAFFIRPQLFWRSAYHTEIGVSEQYWA